MATEPAEESLSAPYRPTAIRSGSSLAPKESYNRAAMANILFRKFKTGYESDATKMVRELLTQRPEILAEQRKGRSIWWDAKLDLDALRRWRESRVNQKAYVYQTGEEK